ncbi:hypothetical protein K493DRAFT_302576 [Basidiobolus meristosporus CBS 931.73]|uniref:RING-type domain-containing protein n=1 Tax=Basidiobolus meristosporus CBS 931.73 TaxID=1314790 RepID=A0A1Y1Y751_9FUNG|nr:hypothetical protein K493DRAFT_302576 [Basidiobolus meristosporus CBS 931.73]|eukprot:ORX93556.1 hypothetical protein K493DRAFT_302576 [Basidiobolus meristosporus CBS 931.73]
MSYIEVVNIASLLFIPIALYLYTYQSSLSSGYEEDDFYDMYLTGNPQSGYNISTGSGALPIKPLSVEMMRQLPLATVKECGIFDCSICREEIVAGESRDCLRKLSCGHIFHEACLFLWLQRAAICPLCRLQVAVGKPEVGLE